jgi:hypothetical protein
LDPVHRAVHAVVRRSHHRHRHRCESWLYNSGSTYRSDQVSRTLRLQRSEDFRSIFLRPAICRYAAPALCERQWWSSILYFSDQ